MLDAATTNETAKPAVLGHSSLRFRVLCTDYDGTLAHHGRVDEATLAGLERLLASGRRLVLVTGRELPQLVEIFPALHLFERVVAENGALLYRSGSREEKLLAEPPPPAFVQLLQQRGVTPLSLGKVIVATWAPHEKTVLETIHDLGLELQVIFNKGAVMVLPAGVNKATGLAVALEEMGLSPHNAVGVGDAENDHAFLSLCECSAAVANALPAVKDRADIVLVHDHGAGVTELIDQIVADDLHGRDNQLLRHQIVLGKRDDGTEIQIAPLGINLLIAGSSGSGKSTLTTGLVERAAAQGYQFCVIDPEGDYSTFEEAIVLGTAQRSPTVEEVMQVLKDPKKHVVVNLTGLPIADRPGFMLQFLPHFDELRVKTGRPHWLVVDETHHLLPSSWEPAALAFSERLDGIVRISVDPAMIAPAALASVEDVVAVGETPAAVIRSFCATLGHQPPDLKEEPLQPGEVLLWSPRTGKPPDRLHVVPGRVERRRHRRKYAEGELSPEYSFYFRGRDNKLNLRAQNLILFAQLADEIDDDTWSYHLRQGEYSRWFRERIKDEELAAEAEQVEQDANLSPRDSRARIKAAIEQRYTQPASPPLPIPGTAAEPRYTQRS
jgi:hydroxymethylpyrimidine pyrophosphatase-like HAD family hydrolase